MFKYYGLKTNIYQFIQTNIFFDGLCKAVTAATNQNDQ